MRYINLLTCLVMLTFVAVQYNDPDALLWAVIYGIPAGWAGGAAFRSPSLRASRIGMPLLWASAALYLIAVIYYWPQMPEFWRKEVWTVEETAREGMGVMIALGTVLLALVSVRRARIDAITRRGSRAASQSQT